MNDTSSILMWLKVGYHNSHSLNFVKPTAIYLQKAFSLKHFLRFSTFVMSVNGRVNIILSEVFRFEFFTLFYSFVTVACFEINPNLFLSYFLNQLSVSILSNIRKACYICQPRLYVFHFFLTFTPFVFNICFPFKVSCGSSFYKVWQQYYAKISKNCDEISLIRWYNKSGTIIPSLRISLHIYLQKRNFILSPFLLCVVCVGWKLHQPTLNLRKLICRRLYDDLCKNGLHQQKCKPLLTM